METQTTMRHVIVHRLSDLVFHLHFLAYKTNDAAQG